MDMVAKIGGAILLAETEWSPKSGISKERAMALAAIEAMREPTDAMIVAYNGLPEWSEPPELPSAEGVWQAMISAALNGADEHP